MAKDIKQQPTVIKRIKKGKHPHHGGAWKIAYADFVTAMMAFFLLMWLLGSTSQGDLQGIAEYFQTPLKVALAGGSGSGNSSSVIQGGGKDLTRRDSEISKGDIKAQKKTINFKSAEAQLERLEFAQMKGLQGKLEKALEANPALKDFRKQLLIDITTEGLRIQIVDAQNRPMFAIGKADVQPYMREILREISRVLNEMPNKISLSGHTDAKPYPSGERGYSNWELSADRANASRRELVAGGIDEGKIVRVVGLASSVLLDANDPFNPINRRISIIVMNRKAEESAKSDGASLRRDADAAGSPAVPPQVQ
ncbi:MAG: flagellar motor protein MotB [Burkholderiales bacterium]